MSTGEAFLLNELTERELVQGCLNADRRCQELLYARYDALTDSSCLDLDPDFTLGLINGATITFQDLTTFADQSFSTSWSFDDGAAVAGQQATHTFDGVGPHRICITVTGGTPGYCSATLCKWLYLGPGDAECELFLDPGFLHVSSGQLVGVLDTSVTSGLEHEITWDFGDGTTSQGRARRATRDSEVLAL